MTDRTVLPFPAPGNEPRSTADQHRFRLSRAGIHNVWQYDQEFTFGAGRLLLRGKNGAGKSKALEMLLPLLLDGDTRRIDATGAGKTTLRWLMLDGYQDSTNRFGYLWVEFTRVSEEGQQHALTLGAAVTASRSAGKAEAEYFLTEERAGTQLRLTGPDRFTVKELREFVGEGNWFPQASAYRAEVMRRLFGVSDAGRYRNLLHLLYQLRRPTIGDRVDGGGLTTVLKEALPPLDDEIIDNVARNLNDLDDVREQLSRLEQTHGAVQRFLTDYRGYLHGVLRNRVQTVRVRLDELAQQRRAAGTAQRELARASAEASESQSELQGLRRELDTARQDQQTLQNSAAYRALGDLREKEHTIQARAEGAKAAWGAVTGAETGEQAHARRLSQDWAQIATELVELREHHRAVQRDVQACGIDGALLGTLPAADSRTLAAPDTVTVTAPDGQEKEFSLPHVAVPPQSLGQELGQAVERMDNVAKVRRSRARTVADTAEKCAAADKAHDEADRREEQREQSEERLENEKARLQDCEQRLLASAVDYRDRLDTWVTALPEIGTEDARAVTRPAAIGAESEGRIAERVPGRDLADEVRAAAQAVFSPYLSTLDGQRDRMLGQRNGLQTELARLQAELTGWEERSDPSPERPAWAVAPRPEGMGAALFMLVDFAEELTSEQRSGLEAALEASGLLGAWVDAEGRVRDQHTRDLLLTPGPVLGGPTLAHALRPVPGGPVSAFVIDRVLSGVECPPDARTRATGGHWVSLDGRWQLGPLHGAHAKSEAEYVGAAVREQTRQRRIAELTNAIDEHTRQLAELTEQLDEVEAQRRRLSDALSELPSGNALVASWEAHEQAAAGVDKAGGELARAHRAAEEARAVATRLRADARAAASTHGLPDSSEELANLARELDRVASALRTATRETDGLKRRVTAFDTSDWEQARTARTRAMSEYDTARERQRAAERELQVLKQHLGVSEAELVAQDRDLRERVLDLGSRTEEAEGQAQLRHDACIRAQKDDESAKERLAAQEQHTVDGAAQLRRPLSLPGLAGAARLDGVPEILERFEAAQDGAIRDRIAALQRLAEEVEQQLGSPGADVTVNTLMNRGGTLRADLAGGYDADPRVEDDIQIWKLHDDTGSHDIATVGRRISAELDEARNRLSTREQEVFQRYLVSELGDHLAGQLQRARDAVEGMNGALEEVRSSHGMGATLGWELAEEADTDVRTAVELLREQSGLRHPDDDARLREALQRRLEAFRLRDPTAGYGVHLREALDYRDWFAFQPYVLDPSGGRRKFNHRIALSQGEQRVISYLILFAAAASHFTSLAKGAPHTPRLILLDDAFAKIDEPTHARLLGLLMQFDLDFVITSERLWGTFANVHDLHIYECVRDPGKRGVGTVHFTWNGSERRLVST